MKNNFTTPSFAKVLKEHGIEIDTPFVYYQESDMDGHLSGINYLGLKCSQGIADVETGEIPEREKVFAVSPAYPFTEVLGWLPKTLIEHLKPTNTPSHRPDYLSYPITSDIDDNNVLKIGYKSEYYGTKIIPMPIEAVITQGLTEGWLTKDNLNLTK